MKFPTEWSRGARYWASAANYDGIVPARVHVRPGNTAERRGMASMSQRDATLHPPSGAPANLLRRRWTQYSTLLHHLLLATSRPTALSSHRLDSLGRVKNENMLQYECT